MKRKRRKIDNDEENDGEDESMEFLKKKIPEFGEDVLRDGQFKMKQSKFGQVFPIKFIFVDFEFGHCKIDLDIKIKVMYNTGLPKRGKVGNFVINVYDEMIDNIDFFSDSFSLERSKHIVKKTVRNISIGEVNHVNILLDRLEEEKKRTFCVEITTHEKVATYIEVVAKPAPFFDFEPVFEPVK